MALDVNRPDGAASDAVPELSAKRRRQLWLAFAVANVLVIIVLATAFEGLMVVMLNHPPPIAEIGRASCRERV